MTTETEQLVVALEARIRDFEKNFQRANRTANTNFTAIEKRAKQSSDRLASTMGTATNRVAGHLKGIGAGFLAGFSLQGAQALVDQATRITNALKAAGLSGTALQAVYDRLFAAAQKNAAPLETLAGLYSKIALAQGELGVSQEELLSFTDNVALALRAAGTDAQSASGALLQLGQALGGGTVRAEEFNSVLEGAPTIAQAVAAGMKEAGGSVAALRALVVDGKVSSEAFFRAFEAGAATLESKVAGAELTVSQQFVRLQNVLVDTAGKLDKVTGASAIVGGGLERLADIVSALGDVADGVANGPLGNFVGVLSQAIGLLKEWEPLSRGLSLITGDNIRAIGGYLSGGDKALSGNDAIRARIGELQKQQAELTGATAEAERRLIEASIGALENQIAQPSGPSTRGGRRRATVQTPISIEDYAAPAASKGGTGGGSRGGRASEDAFAREIAQAQQRIELMRSETAAQAALNPLINDYGAAMEAATMKAQLLQAAKEAGREITPELTAKVETLANAYGAAAAESAKLADGQDRVREAASDFANFGGSLVSGFVSDLRQGKTASEALANAVGRITDKLIDMAIQMLIVKPLMGAFGLAGGGFVSGGDPWSGLRLATGGFVSGPGTPTSDSIPARLSDGEFVVNAAATRRHRALLEAINGGAVPRFADGGIVGTPLSSRGIGGGGQTNVFAPSLSVKVEGGSRGKEADEALASNIAKQVNTAMDAKMAEFAQNQMRNGGMFNRRGMT